MTIRKTLAAFITSAALCSATASATVIGFGITGSYTQGSGQDLPTTLIALGDAGSFQLDPGNSSAYMDFVVQGGGTFSTIPVAIAGYYFLRSYAHGETVGNGNFGSDLSLGDYDMILMNGQTAGAWTATHEGYLGFRTGSGNYGWIEYDYLREGALSTISFVRGAYESVAGVGITTPAATDVPEPASLALFALGALGFAASRRSAGK